MELITKLRLAFMAAILAPFLMASTFDQKQSALYTYQNSIELQDDFLTGVTASGQIGVLGWSTTGGSTSQLAVETNRIGILRRDTSAVSGTTTATVLYAATSSAIDSNNPLVYAGIHRLNTNDANTTVRLGFRDNSFGLLPNNGAYFEKLDADTNWFCVSRNGGVETRVDSGIAITTNFATFLISKHPTGGTTYKINNTNVCSSPIATNITLQPVNFAFSITNSAAASKTLDTDYVQISIFGLIR